MVLGTRCGSIWALAVACLIAACLIVAGPSSSSSHASGFFGREGRIAVAAWVERGDGVGDTDILVMEREGSDVRNLTDQAFSQREPSWSPDGRKIAYRSEQGIHVMRSNGTRAKRIVPFRPGESGYRHPVWPTWSPDGTRIAYAERIWDSATETWAGSALVSIGANGADRREIATFSGRMWELAWSPDASTIALSVCEEGGRVPVTSSCAVYRIGVDGSDLVQIDPQPLAQDRRPRWTADGDLLFVRFLPHHDCSPECAVLYRAEADGSTVQPLATSDDWDGDGRVDEYVAALPSPASSERMLVSVASDSGCCSQELWLWDMRSNRRARIFSGSFGYSFDWQPRCTIRGTRGGDLLRGTPGRDLICGLGGDDTIYGLGGDDVIFGHGGDDVIVGGRGRDIVVGNAGRDGCDRDGRDHSRVC